MIQTLTFIMVLRIAGCILFNNDDWRRMGANRVTAAALTVST